VVAWKVLHGALMVGAKRLYITPSMAPDKACCVACTAAGRPGRVETLSHAFLSCPVVAPALDWLLAAYATLVGQRVPRDALVILGDADWVWQPQAPALWQHFRVAFLGCVWAARSSGRCTPRGLVESVIVALQRGVQRDWWRVVTNVKEAAVGVVPTVWFRGRSPQLALESFQRRWPNQGQWYDVQPGRRQATVRLSPVWPVPLQFDPAEIPLDD
jgi:hypothetical protein